MRIYILIMFFALSKIIWALLSPLTFILVLLGAGGCLSFFQHTKKAGKLLIKVSLILFICLSLLPIGYNIQVFLEQKHPKKNLQTEKQYAGIIVLGGCLYSELSHIYNTPMINGSCERIIEAVKLHKQFPNLPMIYTGGSGSLLNQEYKEADTAKKLFEDLGVKGNKVIFERQSRNTFENMKLSKALINENTKKPWLLVTSAFHMPRAMITFCKGGWNVTPYPVDYNTNGQYKFKMAPPLYNFSFHNRAIKEAIGIIAYGISGKLSMNACDKILK